MGLWEGDGSSGGSGTATTPENTIIVAKSDGDYTTVQAAINVSSSVDAILVHPGTYPENITTKAGGTTNIQGIGNMGSVIIGANTGNALTIPATAMSMAFFKNVKFKSTVTGNNQSKLVSAQGMMGQFMDVVFDYNLTDGCTEDIVDLISGSYVFMNCKFDFDGTGTLGGVTSFITARGSTQFNILQGFGSMTSPAIATGDHMHFVNYESTGLSIVRDFDTIIEASGASFAGHVDFIHMDSTGEIESMSNKILLSTPSGISGSYGQPYHLAAGTGGHIHSTANRINITGFDKNYIGNIESGDALYSHFDDIIAADGIIGAGTYSYANSPSEGDLQMSGDIIKKLVDITADYDASEDWLFGILNSNATSEVTATFNTTEMGSLPTGAKRIFLNSSSASNFILDSNGITIDGATTDRAIYPGGYLIIEKIEDAWIIDGSSNTSFNIDVDAIPNKTFHIDFSDSASVTLSGTDITQVDDAVNGWAGTPSSTGNAIYVTASQNGLNTASFTKSNSPISFGDRVLHSNAAGRGLTIITVVKPIYAGDAIISKYADNVDNREWRFTTSSAVIYDLLSGSSIEANLNFSSTYDEWQIIGMTWEPGGRLSVFKNGYLMGTSSYTTADIESGTANLLVGASDIVGADYMGEIGEIIAISDTPTTAMREAMVSKLGAKWGIDVAVFSSSDSSPFGRDDVTNTIKPLIDGDNLEIAGSLVVNGVDVGAKLDGIESAATADQTDAEILTAVEAESGRNMIADGARLDTLAAYYDIGIAGGIGFGVGIVPQEILPDGMSVMPGTETVGHDNYGNYQFREGSIVGCVVIHWLKIGTGSNGLDVNIHDVKPFSYFASEIEANAAGYFLPRAFWDGGKIQMAYFFDKYDCSKKAFGTGYVASSIKDGLPISTAAAHNPIAALTACADNYYYEVINAAKARDGENGNVSGDPQWFNASIFMFKNLAQLSLAHGQAASSTTYCDWYDATDAENYPKGCNNNALGDYDDPAISYVTDGYSNCGKTGSGTPFAKTTHNGQNCGTADLNGNMYKINLGVTSNGSNYFVANKSTAMKEFTAGNSGVTDHWGAAGIAANMTVFSIPYMESSVWRKMGSGANQVFSEEISGNSAVLRSLGLPKDLNGYDATGINQFGKDGMYHYQLRNELCVLSGLHWSTSSAAGVWGAYWDNSRSNSAVSVGFRCACYPEKAAIAAI